MLQCISININDGHLGISLASPCSVILVVVCFHFSANMIILCRWWFVSVSWHNLLIRCILALVVMPRMMRKFEPLVVSPSSFTSCVCLATRPQWCPSTDLSKGPIVSMLIPIHILCFNVSIFFCEIVVVFIFDNAQVSH